MPTRRDIARWSLAVVSLAAGCGSAAAQTYPDHPIKLVVGFPAGQSSDAAARLVASRMSETLKQPIFIDNRPGAGGGISHVAVKNAPPDGYTLLLGSSGTLAINPALYRKLPYDPIKDFEPIGRVANSPLVLFSSATLPVNSLKELIAYAKARPGKVSYGSPGNGSTAHIAMEMLKQQAGIDLLHVPYKGSPPMITDIVGGQVEVAFDAANSILPFAKGGRVKLLAVSSARRVPDAPDVPTIAEEGLPGFEAVPWSGLLAPKGTPAPIIEKLNAALNNALGDPALVAEFNRSGAYPTPSSPEEFRRFLQGEIAHWGKTVKASGAQVD